MLLSSVSTRSITSHFKFAPRVLSKTSFAVSTRPSSKKMGANDKPAVPTTAPHAWPSPEDWPAAKVRQTFIDYFVNQPGFEHTFWPSSGVIPFDDDTLLFANAVSMHQKKQYKLSSPSSDQCSNILSMIGYESVQAPLPGHRGPQIRAFQAHPCRQQSKVYSCWWKTQRLVYFGSIYNPFFGFIARRMLIRKIATQTLTT